MCISGEIGGISYQLSENVNCRRDKTYDCQLTTQIPVEPYSMAEEEEEEYTVQLFSRPPMPDIHRESNQVAFGET